MRIRPSIPHQNCLFFKNARRSVTSKYPARKTKIAPTDSYKNIPYAISPPQAIIYHLLLFLTYPRQKNRQANPKKTRANTSPEKRVVQKRCVQSTDMKQDAIKATFL